MATDPRGTAQYKRPLSRRRVDAIKAALVPAKIQAGAFGETRLKYPESTEACWQRDRRVECSW